MRGRYRLPALMFWLWFAAACLLNAQPRIEAVTDGRAMARGPAWHPKGDRLAFESQVDGRWSLFIAHLGTKRIEAIAGIDSEARYPAWSPDGLRLAYVSLSAGGVGKSGSHLNLIALASRVTRSVAAPAGDVLAPAWRPDGKSIAYTMQQSGAFSLWATDLETGEVHKLSGAATRDLWPRWSRDGRRIVFFSRRAGHTDDDEIYVADALGGDSKRIATRAGHDFCPTWNPGGNRLALVSETAAGQVIRIITLDGSEVGTAVTGFFRSTEPAWSPDGRRIAFAGAVRMGEPYRVYTISLPRQAK